MAEDEGSLGEFEGGRGVDESRNGVVGGALVKESAARQSLGGRAPCRVNVYGQYQAGMGRGDDSMLLRLSDLAPIAAM